MKGESASSGLGEDPIAAAARSLAQAMADAQQAISAARAGNSDARVALVESRRECAALETKIVKLQQTVKQQREEIAAVRAQLDTVATEREKLAAERVALETQCSTLEADRTKLARDKQASRRAMAGFKREVETLENRFAGEDVGRSSRDPQHYTGRPPYTSKRRRVASTDDEGGPPMKDGGPAKDDGSDSSTDGERSPSAAASVLVRSRTKNADSDDGISNAELDGRPAVRRIGTQDSDPSSDDVSNRTSFISRSWYSPNGHIDLHITASWRIITTRHGRRIQHRRYTSTESSTSN
ncbi:hypothetical protein B0H13DRAFT_934470 [Mycena leptocephala]|nr:hypothetical protein B0H13DRAFT_934470 [Mycena leptocephala]